ncbi:MAG: glycosyltransferase 87 family protein, partial [Roseiflexus sp.]
VCGVLWVWLPTRLAPFLPFYAVLSGVAALLIAWLERWEPHHPPMAGRQHVLLAACGGVVLDALLVVGVARGEWSVAVIAAQAVCVVLGTWQSSRRTMALSELFRIALVVRLSALTTRLLGGEIGSDPDIELFYNYGRATLEMGIPVVEYPSGALIPWAILALPASRELFALALPLCNTIADLVIVWAIWSMGEQRYATGKSAAPACFYALSPMLLPFWHGKYDPLPTAFLALGLTLYVRRRMVWSGVALGIGGALKWTPWLAAPVLALARLRSQEDRRYIDILALSGGLCAAVVATALPFALIDRERLLAPYLFQGSRAITGESVWFLVVLITTPEYWAHLPSPWGSVETGRTIMGIAVGVQGSVLAGLTLSALRFPSSAWRPTILAALAPAAFLLLNRVFSPQYMVTITAALLIACVVAGLSSYHTRGVIVLLTITQAANLLIWPNTVPWWPLPSALMFTTALAALIWMTLLAVRKERSLD